MIKELYYTLEKFAAAAVGGVGFNGYAATSVAEDLKLPACVVNAAVEAKTGFSHDNATARATVSFSLFVAADDENDETKKSARELLEEGSDALVGTILTRDPNSFRPDPTEDGDGNEIYGISFYGGLLFETLSEVVATDFGNIPALKIELTATANIQG